MKINWDKTSFWYFMSIQGLVLLVAFLEVTGLSIRYLIAPPEAALTIYASADTYPVLKKESKHFQAEHPEAKLIRIRPLRKDAKAAELLARANTALADGQAFRDEAGREIDLTDGAGAGQQLFILSGGKVYWRDNLPNKAGTADKFVRYLETQHRQANMGRAPAGE